VRQAMAAQPGRVQLVAGREKRGRGGAVIEGFKRGLADARGFRAFVEMDADYSHDPRQLGALLAKLDTHDMAIGSRYIEGGATSEWGVFRPALSWLANKYVSFVSGMTIRDLTSGYRAYTRAVVEALDFDRIRISGYAVHGEIAYQAWVRGFEIGEIPIHFRNRRRAASKLSAEEIYMALVNFGLLRLRYGPRRAAARSKQP
jgi:dolichol-phosphate mannosyltransferase